MRLSLDNIKTTCPGGIPLTPQHLALANTTLDMLWTERQAERGSEYSGSREGSCKFAALLARALFGGRLAGNDEHVFVVLDNGAVLDLNQNQPDVCALGANAWDQQDLVQAHSDYREALGSCMPRVERWLRWAKDSLPAAAA